MRSLALFDAAFFKLRIPFDNSRGGSDFYVFINEANATVVRMTDPFIADSVENTLQKIFEVHLPADDEWKILKSRGVPEYTMSVEDVEALASQE